MTTSLLPNGEQQFADGNGVPYALGTVEMYEPNTLTPKINWVDKDHLAQNTAPIVLDAAGRCVIWGDGIYRQILRDRFGTLIWDKLTLSFTTSDDVTNIFNTLINNLLRWDLVIWLEGLPAAGEEYPRVVMTRALTLPAGLTATQAKIKFNPTATLVGTIWKNQALGGAAIGTISFSTAGVVTIVFAAPVAFAVGDVISIIWPGAQDLTGAGISITLVWQ